MTQPAPRRTLPSRTENGPICTSSASSTCGPTTAVGWMRGDTSSVMAASVPEKRRGGRDAFGPPGRTSRPRTDYLYGMNRSGLQTKFAQGHMKLRNIGWIGGVGKKADKERKEGCTRQDVLKHIDAEPRRRPLTAL